MCGSDSLKSEVFVILTLVKVSPSSVDFPTKISVLLEETVCSNIVKMFPLESLTNALP